MRIGTWGLRLGLLALLGWVAACASDDFSAVGGDLPLDVGQDADSVLAQLDPPLLATDAQSVPVETTDPYVDRQLLYLGNRDEGQWKATPLFILDFAQAKLVGGEALADYADSALSLELTAANVDTVEFEVRQTKSDYQKGILRSVDLRELSGVDSLTSDLLDQDVSSLLGPIIGGFTQTLADPTIRIQADVETALAHFVARDRLAVAIVDKTPSDPVFSVAPDSLPNSNFVAIASVETPNADLYHETAPNATTATVPELVPKLRIRVDSMVIEEAFPALAGAHGLDNASVEVPVVQDMTHLQRQTASPGDITLSTYRVSRLWLDFDIDGSSIPSDATVNKAVLVLTPRPGSELGGERKIVVPAGGSEAYAELISLPISTTTFEVDRMDAASPSTAGLSRVLHSASSVKLLYTGPGALKVDVTDFVQRDINRLLDDPIGVMIAMQFTSTLNSIDYYGLDAPDALKPRLEIQFTPPADFWE
jgi:hypothetical protein